LTRLLLATLVLLWSGASSHADGRNLVTNGSFEESTARPGVPDSWSAAGNSAIRQVLGLDTGRDGRRCARLSCTVFAGDGGDSHAMVCQTGKIGLKRGRWYRLSFWARAEGIAAGSVEVALVNTRPWKNAGLAEAFLPAAQWQRSEFLFRAPEDLPARTSRLQFWFTSTGTLWLDDVALTESGDAQQWYPEISTDGVKNMLPNSSFECGTAGWGSLTYGFDGWGGNLFRLEGDIDGTIAHHGGHSLRITLQPGKTPVHYFDYYQPVRLPVRRVLAANRGWLRVRPGEPLTLSAFLRADADGVVAQLAANEAPERLLHKAVPLRTAWDRYEFTFTPSQTFVFIAVGLDLDASRRDSASLWIDAVQLERGNHATDYSPRRPVESFLDTGVVGNVFTNPRAGGTLSLHAYNDTDEEQTIQGRLTVTDFFDRAVSEARPTLNLRPHSNGTTALTGVASGRLGSFRADWTPKLSGNPGDAKGRNGNAALSSIRFAVIDPPESGLVDSPFGFNHAYPWDFLVRLARQAGIVWWRDWSAKWQTVEPERGRLDFTIPDTQIERVLGLGGAAEVLLPFPATTWSTTAPREEVAKKAGRDSELRERLPLAFAPKDPSDFGRYAAATVRHYRGIRPPGVSYFQILNEPVYTDYALPREFGYTVDDYLRLLEVARKAMKAEDSQCQVVGGISAGLASRYTREFITRGGLRSVDVFDLHIYDPPRPSENYESPFRALEKLMRAHGGPRPVWITEWGCYADDDPATRPYSFGDETMNRCLWPSERAATEHLVKFTAVSFAHGVRKIFFHAGTCGRINGPSAGGVLFEYGGAPRKMYAGVAALSRLLGVPETCERIVDRDGLHAYVFRARNHGVAVLWCSYGRTRPLQLDPNSQPYDIMGNPLPVRGLVLGETPVYVVGPTADSLLESLTR
jgi:Carbohydrate binding domain